MKILRWSQIRHAGAFHAARTALSRTRPLAYHGHDFAEMFWVDAGRGIHRINGQLALRACGAGKESHGDDETSSDGKRK